MCAVDVSFPLSVVLKVTGITKPKYLVIQTQARGVSAEPVIVYADVFYTRSAARKAEKAADDRLRFKIGKRAFGSRRWAEVHKLPVDQR